MVYTKVQELFITLDLSSNRFDRDIPESIGNLNLRGLRLLNLSNNIRTGQIPQGLKKPCKSGITRPFSKPTLW